MTCNWPFASSVNVALPVKAVLSAPTISPIVVPVTATEAALGAKIEVPTIDGRTLLKIPPGTQSGQKLRLREKGVPSATKDGVRGDEIVEIKVTVPMPRDEKTKELLRELAKLNPEDPRAELWKKVPST